MLYCCSDDCISSLLLLQLLLNKNDDNDDDLCRIIEVLERSRELTVTIKHFSGIGEQLNQWEIIDGRNRNDIIVVGK